MAPTLWLELVATLIVLALAGYSWSRREGSASWSVLLVGLSGAALLVILVIYMIQTQQRDLFGSDAAFYATGFWLYPIGLVAALVGGLFS